MPGPTAEPTYLPVAEARADVTGEQSFFVTSGLAVLRFEGFQKTDGRDIVAGLRVAFQVASVKPVTRERVVSDSITAEPKRSGDRITWMADVELMIRYAYNIQSFQLEQVNRLNGFYEIEAKTGGTTD